MKHIEVVAAVITNHNQILCVQRGVNKYNYISMKYEFPGGKIEPGESFETAIKREILEELKLDIKVEKPFMTTSHEYPDFKITMHSFICTCENRELTLTEHIDFMWLTRENLSILDWAAADIFIVDELFKIKHDSSRPI